MSKFDPRAWSVSETIGISIINPQAISNMKAIPRLLFKNEQGGIEIRRASIVITGSHEAAAKAFAEEILSKKNAKQGVILNSDFKLFDWSYFDVIKITYADGKYSVDLTGNGVGIISPVDWDIFKKNVEKICNGLKAFL